MATQRERGLYQKHGVWWFAQQKKGKRLAVSLETKDYAQAVVKARDMRDKPDLHTGGQLRAEIERFLSWKLERREYGRETVDAARVYLRRLAAIVGDVSPARVTTRDAERFMEAVRTGGAGPDTVRTYVAYARSFFNWCVCEAETVRISPFRDLKLPRFIPAARKDFCEIDERDRLIANCKDDQLKFVLYCGFHAGLRRKEISEARPAWFDLKRNLINLMKISPAEAARTGLDPFELKGREERTIPLSASFARFLKKFLDADDAYCLAPTARRRKARYRFDFRRPFTEYMTAQKARVTPHKMRRTFASLHVSHGTPLYHVAKWLGDDERTAARHYGHLVPDHAVFHRGITGVSERKVRRRFPRPGRGKAPPTRPD